MSQSVKKFSVAQLAAETRSKRVMVKLPGLSCDARDALVFANSLPCEARKQLAFCALLGGA